jgi:hypothetical protein
MTARAIDRKPVLETIADAMSRRGTGTFSLADGAALAAGHFEAPSMLRRNICQFDLRRGDGLKSMRFVYFF